MCFMDTLQITLTLLYSTGMSREKDRGERGAGREGMEMEMGEWANKTADGYREWKSEIEQNGQQTSVKETKGTSTEVVKGESCLSENLRR